MIPFQRKKKSARKSYVLCATKQKSQRITDTRCLRCGYDILFLVFEDGKNERTLYDQRVQLEDKRSNLFFRWFSPILSLAPRLLPRWKSDHLRHQVNIQTNDISALVRVKSSPILSRIQMAKNRLKTAIVEFYRELTLLKSFRASSHEFLKILCVTDA